MIRADRRSTVVSLIAFDVDLLIVVVFVAIGRNNHDENPGLAGLVETAAPFAIGLILAWVLTKRWTEPFSARTGLLVWVGTVAVGMLCRRLIFDEGTAASFVVVASVFLGTFINGWRLLARRAVVPRLGSFSPSR